MKTTIASIALLIAILITSVFQLTGTVITGLPTVHNPPMNKDQPGLSIPYIEKPPVIDGNIEEWKAYAFHDGMWDVYRVRHAGWYQPGRNRLTDHGNEPPPGMDLQSRYYTAWDSTYFYMGAIV